MAYRRRDSGKASYSSADAYRHLPAGQAPVSPTSSSSHAPASSSSEEEAHLASRDPHRPESPVSYPEEQVGDNHPLSPPRPFFLAGSRKDSNASDRGSWSSITESVDPASDSDRDNEAALAAGASQPGVRRVRANTAGSTGASAARPRNHHRRRSSGTVPAVVSAPLDSSAQTPSSQPVNGRPPPSAFPFLSHAGNPDPGMPIPGNLARRPSHESFRRLSGGVASPPATATGVAYPTSPSNVGGYSALRGERASMDVADGYSYAPVGNGDIDELGRPHPHFMGEADRASYNGNGGSVYRNSAAAAMAGSSAALAGGKYLSRVQIEQH
jgi:hypothetical protein